MLKKENTELLLLLLSAWTVYGACQQDVLLPAIAAVTIVVSYFSRNAQAVVRRSFFGLPWPAVIIISIVFGALWRGFLPAPGTASSFTPKILSALQSGSIIGAIFVWFSPAFSRRSYYLRLLAWAVVALSVNVAFKGPAMTAFWLFCLIGAGFMLAGSWRAAGGKYAKRRYQDYIFPVFFTIMALGVFTGVVNGVQLGDKVFMHILNDYTLPFNRNALLGLNSTLRLNGPGSSGRDIRPVMEIERNGRDVLYLRTQVFEQYNNGTWTTPEDVPRRPLPHEIDPSRPKAELIMFERLENIIPVPQGVVAVKSKGDAFEKDINGMVYGRKDRKVRKVSISLDDAPLTDAAGEKRMEKLTALPGPLKEALKAHVERIAGGAADPFATARAVESHFRDHFKYTLDVKFSANDEGILLLLNEKRPAYCSYFASAMALMLRERGIPARIATGFLATEISGFGNDRFLLRVRDAHAWTEALLPSKDGTLRWVRFDPTPAAARMELLNSGVPLSKIADWLWRSQISLQAWAQGLDMDKVTVVLLVLVMAVILAKNFKSFFFKWQGFKTQGTDLCLASSGRSHNVLLDDIYRRYETVIKNVFDITRRESETDADLLKRLRGQQGSRPETLATIEVFLDKYRGARFGNADGTQLKDAIKSFEGEMKKR